MLGLIEEIIRWVGPAFAVAGYAIVGAAVLLERSILVGLIIPGDVVLALGGIYAGRGDLDVVWVAVIGTLAACVGESVGYWLGRRYGVALLRRLPLVNRLEGRLHEAEDHFRRHGGKTVAIGRYATAAGAFIPFTAGLSKMSYARFLAFDVPAIVLWATGIVLVGYYLQAQIELVDKILSRFGWIMLGALVALIVGRVVWKRVKGKGKGKGKARSRGAS